MRYCKITWNGKVRLVVVAGVIAARVKDSLLLMRALNRTEGLGLGLRTTGAPLLVNPLKAVPKIQGLLHSRSKKKELTRSSTNMELSDATLQCSLL